MDSWSAAAAFSLYRRLLRGALCACHAVAAATPGAQAEVADEVARQAHRVGRSFSAMQETGGTCIEERFSPKGPVRFWWTPENVYGESPYEIIDWFTMRKGGRAEPFIRWCRERYTNADGGSAVLVETGPCRRGRFMRYGQSAGRSRAGSTQRDGLRWRRRRLCPRAGQQPVSSRWRRATLQSNRIPISSRTASASRRASPAHRPRCSWARRRRACADWCANKSAAESRW